MSGDGWFSQFGEDRLAARILDEAPEIVGRQPRVGEFGAGDGLALSNTAAFWRGRRWPGVLAEADPRLAALAADAAAGFDVDVHHATVTPANVNDLFPGHFTVLSVDIDGDDWAVVEAWRGTADVLIVEHNQTVPPWLSVRPAALGSTFGCSAAAWLELLEPRGYHLVGGTDCNLILMSRGLDPTVTFRVPLLDCLPMAWMAAWVSDYTGRHRVLVEREDRPWGDAGEPSTEPLLVSRYDFWRF